MVEVEKVKASIPSHLRQYIVDQYETQYSPEDQAVWRYCLRQLKNYLSSAAHSCYSEGLEKTGITVNEIPSIDEMCLRLKEFGWLAVPVSGFIPPAAFMELQSLGILPIATGMRSAEHILYTPAPDIVHEAAGHAPILVDKTFAKYLKSYAKIAKNALIANHDLEQYDAIRSLSDLKEHPDSTPQEIQSAEDQLAKVNGAMTFVSEAAILGRMNWWTAEYGLIGDLSSPKIYGAGLLSSIGEASQCLNEGVKKIPLSVKCVDYAYDITEPQPQLFVASSFEEMEDVLEELSETLAYKKGGTYGLEKAIEAETVNSVELSSGLQISGVLSTIHRDPTTNEAVSYRFSGPSQLCYKGKEINGHGNIYHKDGFSSPLGFLKNYKKDLCDATPEELASLGIIEGEVVSLSYESGVELSGQFTGSVCIDKKNLIWTFKSCKVTLNEEVLFDPSWGDFDLAIGSSVVSVFAGPADSEAYGIPETFSQRKVAPKKLTPRRERLQQLYLAIRTMRRSGKLDLEQVRYVAKELKKDFPEQWLPRLEILELLSRGWLNDPVLKKQLTTELHGIQTEHPHTKEVIDRGLELSELIF